MNDQPPSITVLPTGPPGRSDLFAIVYVSTATRPVALAELMHLLDGARRRNQREDVTGLLLYADQHFMQYLEGPAGGLSRVYDIIKAHPLHYGLIDLVRQPIPARAFTEWSMAFHLAGAFGASAPDEQDAMLARRLAEASPGHAPARELLSTFWAQGTGSVTGALQRHHRERSQQRLWRDADTGTSDR